MPDLGLAVDREVGERLGVADSVPFAEASVLAGYTGEDYARSLPTLDLLDEVRRSSVSRIGLEHLARETLGTAKSGDGLQCLEWVREGRLDLVETYCRKDVEILKDLLLHGRQEGCVYHRDKSGDRRLRLPVA